MLNPKKLGLAGGIVWGVGMFVTTWASIWFGYGTEFLALMADVYPGFEVSVVGSFVGFAYGFVDVGIGLFILAWLYNKINV